MAKALKNVMMEDEENQEHKKLLKGADYLAADSECWRQYRAGSRDEYFRDAIMNRKPNIESGKELLTPACMQLYDYFFRYVERLDF